MPKTTLRPASDRGKRSKRPSGAFGSQPVALAPAPAGLSDSVYDELARILVEIAGRA